MASSLLLCGSCKLSLAWPATNMDKAGIAAIEKENLKLQITLLKAQVAMSRTPLSESIKE